MNRVVIVGAGPAGLAAAVCAAQGGRQVTLIDDNPEPGGQIWRGDRNAKAKLDSVKVALLSGARVVAADGDSLIVETAARAISVPWDWLILATGARERFLPFPGWTLPGVMGAGALQAFIKSGLDVRGKRVVVAGTGPLLLAVAALARQKGARVEAICEQASAGRVHRLAFDLSPAKLLQALSLKRALWGVSKRYSSHVAQAWGGKRLEGVRLEDDRQIECDYLACGYGLVPNQELVEMFRGRENVFAVGECTRIGGVFQSVTEGAQAGHRAAGDDAAANRMQPAVNRARRFADALARTYELRPELRSLPRTDTVVCRCEGVTFGALQSAPSWKHAKLHTRCGMGPCQGRVCGPAVEFLFGWTPDSVRPPVLPARVQSLAGDLNADA